MMQSGIVTLNPIARRISLTPVNRFTQFAQFGFSDLFKKGEQGVIFDLSTIGTLYQTTAMQVPAIPGDPFGMMLDQSQWGGKGLGDVYGPELITNGDFATDTDWLKNGANVTISGGVGRVVSTDGSYAALSSAGMTVKAGTYYLIEFDLLSLVAGVPSVDFAGNVNNVVTDTSIGRKRLVISATSGGLLQTVVIKRGSSVTDFTIDNVSVREVTVANALAPILGPELVMNGGFDTDTDWAKSGGVAISGGAATLTASGTNAALQQTGLTPSTAGQAYLITYTVVSNTLNAGQLRVGGFSGGSMFGSTVTNISATVGVNSVIIYVTAPSGAGNTFDLWYASG